MAAAASPPAALATDAPPGAGREAVRAGSGSWAAALTEVTGAGSADGCAGNVWGLRVEGGLLGSGLESGGRERDGVVEGGVRALQKGGRGEGVIWGMQTGRARDGN